MLTLTRQDVPKGPSQQAPQPTRVAPASRYAALPLGAFLPLPQAKQALDSRTVWPQRDGKTPLAAWLSDSHMPLVFDQRNAQSVRTRASVLVSPRQNYLLGSAGAHAGSYGKIRSAVDLLTGEALVVKVVRRQPRANHTPQQTRSGHRQTAYCPDVDPQAMREARYMKLFGGLRELVTDERRHYFVMPYGQQSFASIIEPTSLAYRSEMARVAGWHMLKQADDMHRRHLVHNDIKPDNMLFDAHQGSLHLIDFGLTERFDPNTHQTPTAVMHGTYPPPTRFVLQLVDGKVCMNHQTPASPVDDVWAIGVSILQVLAPPGDAQRDPFYWRNVGKAGTAPFTAWMQDMRERVPNGPINLSQNNPYLHGGRDLMVQRLHEVTAKAYAVDAALTMFVVSHLLQVDRYGRHSAGALSVRMRESKLLNDDVWARGCKALQAAFPGRPHSDDARILAGLQAVRETLKRHGPQWRPMPSVAQAA